jgi:hypothetical protein
MLPKKQPSKSASRSASLTVPELDQSKTIVLNTLRACHHLGEYRSCVDPAPHTLVPNAGASEFVEGVRTPSDVHVLPQSGREARYGL